MKEPKENLLPIVREQEKSILKMKQRNDDLFEENRQLEKDKWDLMSNLDGRVENKWEVVEVEKIANKISKIDFSELTESGIQEEVKETLIKALSHLKPLKEDKR